MQRFYKQYYALSVLLVLAACGEGSVAERIGMERKPPDEFRVLSRPPLNVPPEFNLDPPTDASLGGGLDVPASQAAEQVVFGTNMQTHDPRSTATLHEGHTGEPRAQAPSAAGDAKGLSAAEQNFLNSAGAKQADSGIRQIIRQESGTTGYEEEKSALEKLRTPANKEPTVDALKEAERLKANQDAGKPVTEGETPTKTPKDRGIIDKIF